jgi:hypothetical protein
MKNILKWLEMIFCILLLPTMSHGQMPFQELFEDTNFASRGWYDGPSGVIDCTEHAPVSGSDCSLKAVWASGSTKPSGGSWIFRHKFTSTDSVYFGVWIKHTTNWAGSGLSYHPHMFYFLTNLERDYSGLAWDHLKFNQIIFAPYLGNGSPVNQQGFWIDNLSIANSRDISQLPPSPPQNLRILNNEPSKLCVRQLLISP